MVINLEKDNLIVVLFKQASVKRILLRAVVESNAKDKIERSELISQEISDIEDLAWQELRDQHPEFKPDTSFTFNGYPPSIIVNEI